MLFDYNLAHYLQLNLSPTLLILPALGCPPGHGQVMIVFRNHYVCGPHPQHLLTGIDWENFELPSSFGGVVSFPPDAFVRVNGFSNLYWGWGREELQVWLAGSLRSQDGLGRQRGPRSGRLWSW